MILELAARGRKGIAICMLAVLYLETVLPQYAMGGRRYVPPVISSRVTRPVVTAAPVPVLAPVSSPVPLAPVSVEGGPTQPEASGFRSASDDNLVDLFTGDFNYSIPLMSVDGYPITLGYSSGIGMDQEASWVGLGWNLSPGAVTRNMRGLPDEFDGTDSVQKTMTIKENKTIGVSASLGSEMFGVESPELSMGLFYNNYKGLGIEEGISMSTSLGASSMGAFSGSLSLNNNSQEGMSASAGIDYRMKTADAGNLGPFSGGLSLGSSYSSRGGLRALQVSGSMTQGKSHSSSRYGTSLSFANPTFMPAISVPYTTGGFDFNAKMGVVIKGYDANLSVSGYVSKQVIAEGDKRLSLPAYGYLNAQHAKNNAKALLDYNREKDIPYREKPSVPNIGLPFYTHDVFAISGEGTGGTFRAYRSDIGFVHDHYMRTKDASTSGGVDLGSTDLAHIGVNFKLTRANTETGPWLNENLMARAVAFRDSDRDFEAAYFRNPGEKTANAKDFYHTIGDDDVVAVKLHQAGTSSPGITATNYLQRYRNKKLVEEVLVGESAYKKTRDKRTQSISYMTAAEASETGLSVYLEDYKENVFDSSASCNMVAPALDDDLKGYLVGQFYEGMDFKKLLFTRRDESINFNSPSDFNRNKPAGVPTLNTKFSARWTGKLRVDVTARYMIITESDDAVRLYVNGQLLINNYKIRPMRRDTIYLNLVAGQEPDLKLEYFNNKGVAKMHLRWSYLGLPTVDIPSANFIQPDNKDYFYANDTKTRKREKRVNSFRKPNHISQVDVLNDNGQRYVYGLPVYNLGQHDATFAVNESNGSNSSGLVSYTALQDGVNNSTNDQYYSAEDMPAYPHSFLLTGILTPDYVDLTGNGISDDDPGNAVRFNYTRVAGVDTPFKWRAPYGPKAEYNEGLKTDNRDGRGSYVAGKKELWYLHSIESKNMVATFRISEREDQPSIDSAGNPLPVRKTRKLDEINLYVKADFMKHGVKARPVKTAHFRYSYKLCTNVNGPGTTGKLTLDTLWFTYNGNEKGKLNPYVFHYHNNNPPYATRSTDRWGTYKNPADNPGGLSNADYPYTIQDSVKAASNAAAWCMDSIQLPSGGGIKVQYESDDYAFVQNKRATQMFTIAGFSSWPPPDAHWRPEMYGEGDKLYVAMHVPRKVSSDRELYNWYLEGIDTMYFRFMVNMPGDKFGSGGEFVSGYAVLDPSVYGFINGGNTIWVKVKAIDKDGQTDNTGSVYSPFSRTAFQFLRLNLPSKAYPGSDSGGELDGESAIRMMLSSAGNFKEMLLGFDNVARGRNWCKMVDVGKSMVRLDNPWYKKYGGGLRVKSVRSYDHWNAMTGQKESVYGKEYEYTITDTVKNVARVMSSGVAAYEPMIGGEENPFHSPMQYKQSAAMLAPVTLGYTEYPLGESLFPSPMVGYRRVIVRSIHGDKRRSATGHEENLFYTTYEYPTITDYTNIADNKKRFKPALASLLKFNARHYVAVSQGFKVELNDMNGKPRMQAVYGEGSKPVKISGTEYFYHVDKPLGAPHLNNTAMVMFADGHIEPDATVGKDIELMMDMREQRSLTNATSLNFNTDLFSAPAIPPFWLIPSLLDYAKREETKYRSIATTKVINRHGLLDSIRVTDKGSVVVTRNLLYDAESGEVLLTATKNEFNDDIYNFTYPSGWVYDGMSGAYKNIGAIFNGLTLRGGKITAGLNASEVPAYFASGDEILVGSKEKVAGEDCEPVIATYPTVSRITAVDANFLNGGAPDIYFMTEDGQPFTGDGVSMKIMRSGRRNISAPVGQVSMMVSPLHHDLVNDKWSLEINDDSKVLTASVVEYQQSWKVADKKKAAMLASCLPQSYDAWAGPDACGQRLYGNQEVSEVFVKNDCGNGGVPPEVTYRVAANSYGSYISQDDADEKAWDDVMTNGQEYANTNGVCGDAYPSDSIGIYRKNDCSDAGTGEWVTVALPKGWYISTISQLDADEHAQAEAQRLANLYGRCVAEAFVGYSCSSGYGQVSIYLKNGPLSQPLTVMVGFAQDSSGVVKYAGSNSSMFEIPYGSEVYQTNNYQTFLITIPAGQSMASAPTPWYSYDNSGSSTPSVNLFPCFSGNKTLQTLWFGKAPLQPNVVLQFERAPDDPLVFNVVNVN